MRAPAAALRGQRGAVVAFRLSDALFGGAPGVRGRTVGARMDRLTYTVVEAAELLGISRTSAYECVRRGEIPSITLGRRVVVSRVALQRLLESTTDSTTTVSR